MIRALTTFAGFLIITIALLALQPRRAPDMAKVASPAPEVTRAQQDMLLTQPPADTPKPPMPDALLTDAVTRALEPSDTCAPGTIRTSRLGLIIDAATLAVPVSDQDLRQMTWNTLAQVDKSLGRSAAPGAQGSLLNVLVTRSQTDGTAPQSAPDPYLDLLRAAAPTRP